MNIGKALREVRGPFVSFEFFPPAEDDTLPAFYKAAENLASLNPLFVSVTYGAGGAKQEKTFEVASHLAQMDFTVMSHLTCVNAGAYGLAQYLSRLQDAGVENVLALRGDPPAESSWVWHGPFRHATDLVRYIRLRAYDMGIGVAGYPCPHPESETYEDDRQYTLRKLESGADFVITQLFFDVREYFDLVSWLRAHGCTHPVIPGILPIQSFAGLRRVLSLCGASIPARLFLKLEEADRKGGVEAVKEVGLEFAVDQITRLLIGGAPGVHLYSLNRSELCMRIVKEVGLA